MNKEKGEMDLPKIALENELLRDENEKLHKRVAKLEKNGIRKMDARLETLEEDMTIVWKMLAKLENMEGQIDNVHSDVKLIKDYSRSTLKSNWVKGYHHE
jgi:regulator of replication initiation timing